MKFNIQHIRNHEKWGEISSLSNGIIEVEIPTTIGPRITACRFKGENNIFYEAPDVEKYLNSEEWYPYGGHRLWHAPEVNPRSYYPDNHPVKIEQTADAIAFIQSTETSTCIQKSMRIHLKTEGNTLKIDHILTNQGLWPVELAGWALSMMRPNGKAVIPLPRKIPFPQELQPNHAISVWPYTDLADKRLTFSDRFITIRQDPQAEVPLKLGMDCRSNWIGYFMGDSLFIKKFNYIDKGRYPDFGCSVEVYTDGNMLEMETLSPLQTILPGESIVHQEEWGLWKMSGMPANDQEINKVLQEFVV
jgi:hypothetical protein